MSEAERRIADTKGRFLQAVKDGRAIDDVSWTNGRILLSNKRLVLASGGGKRTVPLSAIESLDDRVDVNQSVARVADYTSLRFDGDVLLVSARDHDAFERDLYAALLDGELLLLRHPAVEGGVVQDTEWEKARVKLDEEVVNVASASGGFVTIELDDVGAIDVDERTVLDASRSVIEVAHTVEETSVETYLSGTDRHVSVLASLLRKGEERNQADLDLDEKEKQVLMALYSGVSPFEIPDFTGVDVDRVEEIFERLIELDVLDEVRKRREVTLTTRGRNLASEAINEE